MSAEGATDAAGGGNPGAPFWVVVALFLLSGLSSLIYQVVWTRMLVFVFGSGTFATSTVLGVFMGGLAIGSLLAGRYADRSRNPFLLYGLLEGIIGIWALAAPFLFSAATPIYKQFFLQLHLQPVLFGALRCLVAAAILLPPTICMGATLPLLSRFVTRTLDTVGDRVGKLYAVNTLGAVIGSLLGGFVLLPELGLNLTIISAASVNILLAVSTYFLSRLWKTESAVFTSGSESKDGIKAPDLSANSQVGMSASAEGRQDVPPVTAPPAVLPENSWRRLPPEVLATMAGFAVSGSLAMIYEVAWTRALLMIIGSTTYAFTVMLSTFLIGIFVGSYICAKLVDRLKNPIIWFGVAEIYVCLGGFLSLKCFSYLPELNLALSFYFGKDSGASMLLRFLCSGAILLPISIALGAIFPLAVKVCSRDLERVGSSVGNLYFMNTTGAIAGALFAGFVIMPLLGTEGTLLATTLANFVLGTLMLLAFAQMRNSVRSAAFICLLGSIYWAMQQPKIWDMSSIVFAQSDRRRLQYAGEHEFSSFSDWRDRMGSLGDLVFYKEGLCANVAVAVARSAETGSEVTSLFTSGHADASDGPDMENQAMLAVFPLLFSGSARDVCVVGWGSGVTAGYALRFPVKQVVCAEIEPVVFETSKFFHKVNFMPERDSRLLKEPSDGRNYLLCTDKNFDVIISEPSNPWQAGVCNLFSAEYFKVCFDNLRTGGIFSMWTQINEIKTKNLVQIFAALKKSFPCVFVMDSGQGDLVTLALKEDRKLSYESLLKTMSLPELRPQLERFKLKTPEDFIARIHVCPGSMKDAVRNSLLNSDDKNYLEYDVAKSYENAIFVQDNYRWLLENGGEIWDYIDWGPISDTEKAKKICAVAQSCLRRSLLRCMRWAEQSMKIHPNPEALLIEVEASVAALDYKKALQYVEKGQRLFPSDARFCGLEGILAYKRGDFSNARKVLEKSIKMDATDLSMRYYLALTYSGLDVDEFPGLFAAPQDLSPAKVLELLGPAVKNQRFLKSKPATIFLIADACLALGKFDEAIEIVRQAKSGLQSSLAWRLLGTAYECRGEFTEAKYCFNQAYKNAEAEIVPLKQKAVVLRRSKKTLESLRQIQRILGLNPLDDWALSFLKDYASQDPEAARYYRLVEAGL